jgi:predicted peptidase
MKAMSHLNFAFRSALIVVLAGLLIIGCATNAAHYQEKIEYKLVVEGFEWGPSITKTILCFTESVSAASLADDVFTVTAGNTPRTITGVYLSDDTGNRIADAAANFVTIELKTGFDQEKGAIENSSPFTFDLTVFRNVWVPLDIYTIETATGKTISIGGAPRSIAVSPNNYIGKVSPATDGLAKSSFTADGIKINTAAYEPEAFKSDAGKNALIIWLHGAGGGNAEDVDIALYDNDVTEIMNERIQQYFKADGLEGAYVLYPQCATWWMDDGNGEMSARGPVSKYTEALKATIDNYIEGNSDVDRTRIYIGGCSNGGYMIINMMVHYPSFFAAGYPISEAFASSEITEASLKNLAEEAIWFVVSADDTTVTPVSDFTLDTYVRLVQTGAQNVHLSFYEHVIGEDAPGVQYDGHWSWVYTLQDRSIADQDAAAVKANGAQALSTASAIPVQVNGKNVSLWGWIAVQKKAN